MLSISMQFVSVCSVYVNKWCAYSQHTCNLEEMVYQGNKKSHAWAPLTQKHVSLETVFVRWRYLTTTLADILLIRLAVTP